MIEVNNLTAIQVNEEFFRKVAEKVFRGEKQGNKDLSIALVGQGRIRELNKRYRGKNRVTDVLAFSQNQKSKIKDKKFPIFPKSDLSLGEIVICLREVKKNSKRFNSVFEKELARVLIHGILHLLGYNHEKEKNAARGMEEKQKYYLELFF